MPPFFQIWFRLSPTSFIYARKWQFNKKIFEACAVPAGHNFPTPLTIPLSHAGSRTRPRKINGKLQQKFVCKSQILCWGHEVEFCGRLFPNKAVWFYEFCFWNLIGRPNVFASSWRRLFWFARSQMFSFLIEQTNHPNASCQILN